MVGRLRDWQRATPSGACSVAHHHAFAPGIGTAKPALGAAFNGLQTAGHVCFADCVATGCQSVNGGLVKALVALSAKARITASVEPPAGQGQISLMGLAGKA